MTTAVADPATPNTVYVPGVNIEAVISSFDEDLARLQSFDREGNYIKFDKVFDIMLDIRNKLKDLLN